MFTNEEIMESIVSDAMLRHVILGHMILKIGVRFVDRPDIPACGFTNGKGVYINEPQCREMGMRISNYKFVIAHEILHILTLTMERQGNRHQQLWNYATDYAINDMLLNNVNTKDGRQESMPIGKMLYKDELKTPENPTGQVWLYNDKYRDWSAEKIYDDLLEQFKKEHNGKSPEQVEQEMEDAVKDFLDKIANGQKEVDAHEFFKGMDANDIAKVKAQIQDAIEQNRNSSRSDSAMDRALELFLKEPPFDWKGYLLNYLKAFMKADYSWKTPNRRSCAIGYTLPGTRQDVVLNVGIAIDTSGSVGQQEINDFMSHIQKIANSFKNYNIDVWCFSTKVHENTLTTFTKSKTDLTQFQLESLGGTDIASNFHWIKDKKKRYDCFICMTDGYDSISDLEFSHCPVIWAITGNDNFENPVGVKRANCMRLEF